MKNFKPLDYFIALIVIAIIVAGVAMFYFKRQSPAVVLKEQPIEFQVFFKSVSVTTAENPFKLGASTFITIRNVPYTKLKIVKMEYDKKKIVIPSNKDAKGYIVVEDASMPLQYDFLITLRDNAKITDDGAVVGGNKIKLGLPIVLEGADYKYTGVVSGITLFDEEKTAPKKAK